MTHLSRDTPTPPHTNQPIRFRNGGKLALSSAVNNNTQSSINSPTSPHRIVIQHHVNDDLLTQSARIAPTRRSSSISPLPSLHTRSRSGSYSSSISPLIDIISASSSTSTREPSLLSMLSAPFYFTKHLCSSTYNIYCHIAALKRISLLMIGILVTVMMACFMTYTITDRIVLYLSTGSFLYHDYSWYSIENSAYRLHESLYADQQHLTIDAVEAKLELASCYNVDEDVKSRITPAPPVPHINDIIYVTAHRKDYDYLPYLWDTILLNDFHVPYHDDASSRHLLPLNENNNALKLCNVYTTDLSSLPSYCVRRVKWKGERGVQFQFLPPPPLLSSDILPHISRLLIIGDNFESPIIQPGRILELFHQMYVEHNDSIVPEHLSIGLLSLSDEACNNPHTHGNLRQLWPTTLHPRLGKHVRLVAEPYGDCMLSQLIPYHMIVPLGPATMHSFPSYLDPMRSAKPLNERTMLLNMQTTISVEKLTRMQAWLVAHEYCKNLPARYRYSMTKSEGESASKDKASTLQHDLQCYIYNNDLLFRIASKVDEALGTSLTTSFDVFADPVTTTYLPLLNNSRYTLCPAGKNPTAYRVWESIMAGSIPVVEDINMDTLLLHPYGLHFRCRQPDDVHHLLKALKAPVLYVNEWSQLPSLLNSITDGDAMEIQRKLSVWYEEMVYYLRDKFIDAAMKM